MNKQEIVRGIKAAIPVALGYFPTGLAFGVLAVQAGLSIREVFLMSFLVYAGSAQFIAVGLISAGASVGAIIITTLLVNSRHTLMSASLAPYMKKISNKLLAIIGFGVTDETFAVAMGTISKEENQSGFFLGLNLTSQLSWVACTVIGAATGNLIPNPEVFGLHFALPAMFIALLVLQLGNRLHYLIAVIAIVLSLVFKLLIPGNWYIILASVLAATIGVIIESCQEKSSSSSLE